MFVAKNFFNRTLAIDSPFQTFAIELLVEFIDYVALPLLSPETFPRRVNQDFLAHLALFVRMDDTIKRTNTSLSINT